MRVMFAIWPNPSHLYPLVPLAWALRAAGHEVCVASHAAITDEVAATGLQAFTLGDPARMPVPMGPGRAYPAEREKVLEATHVLGITPDEDERWNFFSQFMLPAMWDFHPYGASPDEPQEAMDALVDLTRSWKPDLVLWDPCVPGAAVAARAAGARHARWITGPDFWGWSIDRMSAHEARPDAAPLENPLVATVGPVAERHGVLVDLELLLGEWTVTTVPEPMDDERGDPLRMRWVPFSAQTPAPPWLMAPSGRPRVGLSLGLSWRRYLEGGWDHVPVLLEALGGLDVDVVATLNAKQLADVTTLPANVRTVDYVALDQLLPTCSAFVHHGGFATYAAAATYGVPQLVTDTVSDRVLATSEGDGMGATRHAAAPPTVRHLLATGAGEAIDIGEPSVPDIRAAVTRALGDEGLRSRTRQLQEDTLAIPSPAAIVTALEDRVLRTP